MNEETKLPAEQEDVKSPKVKYMPDPPSKEEEAEVAKVRSKSKLQPVKRKIRRCLRCEAEFESANSGVRSCDDCRAVGRRAIEGYWDSW